MAGERRLGRVMDGVEIEPMRPGGRRVVDDVAERGVAVAESPADAVGQGHLDPVQLPQGAARDRERPEPIVAREPDVGAVVGEDGPGPERQEQPTSGINLALDPIEPAVDRAFPDVPGAILQDVHPRIEPAQVEVAGADQPGAEHADGVWRSAGDGRGRGGAR